MATVTTPASPATGNVDWRQEWHEFDGTTYLNLAGQSPVPKCAIRAIQSAIEWKKFPHHIPDTAYFDLPNKVRTSIAKLIGGKTVEVTPTPGATTGLVAAPLLLPCKPRDEVLALVSAFSLPSVPSKPI